MNQFKKLDKGVHVFKGAVNAGIFRSNGKVLLVDCCDLLPDALQEVAGGDEVDIILFTQHRRPNACGVYRWSGTGARSWYFCGDLIYGDDPAVVMDGMDVLEWGEKRRGDSGTGAA